MQQTFNLFKVVTVIRKSAACTAQYNKKQAVKKFSSRSKPISQRLLSQNSINMSQMMTIFL